MTLEILILHNRECHVWQTLESELKQWLRLWGLAAKAKVRTELISNDAEARKRKFFGSPQVLINGCDIDPLAQKVTAYHALGCRLYVWKNKVYEYPPKEMVEEAILQLSQACQSPKSQK
jgi:hypothetical protein